MRLVLPKPDKDTRRQDDYRSVFLMNRHKILNEILAKQIQQHIKRLHTMNMCDLSQEYKVCSTYANQSV